jgi:hypothetical protein
MKHDLRIDLANYYNSFGNFNFSEKSVNFIESGKIILFAEIDHSLLNKNAKFQLEKILKDMLAKTNNDNDEENDLLGWSLIFDEQTIKYEYSNGFNDNGSMIIYFQIYDAINKFCETLHQNLMKSKIDSENLNNRRKMNGNF